MEWVIDPRNPGEVFACAGLAHLAWREDRAAETGFERDGHRRRFVAPDLSAPFERLAKASPEETADVLCFAGVELDWWMDGGEVLKKTDPSREGKRKKGDEKLKAWGLNPELRIWAGNQSALTVHENLFSAVGDSNPSDWTLHRAPPDVKGNSKRRAIFNVDTECTWNALEMGFSLNEHGIKMSCRPWVGLLASVGLQAFPVQGSKEDGFRYRLWRPSSMAVAIAAFGGHGPSVYSTDGLFVSKTGKSGENTVLRRADSA